MAWFTRGDRTARRGELLESAVGVSTSLSGVIRSDGGVRIDGHFEGHIDVAGNVVVGEAGVVQVDVLRARNITVGGSVTGNIECGGRLEILATGQVVGDIVADAIMIDQGGVFQGASRMRNAMPVLPPPAAPTSRLTSGAAAAAADRPAGVDNVIIDLVGAAPAVEPAGEPADEPPTPAAPSSTTAPAAPSSNVPSSTAQAQPEAPSASGPVRRVASPAPEPPSRAEARAAGQPTSSSRPAAAAPRAEPSMDFALDIEPVIPDTAAGSASGAVHQPQPATTTTTGTDGARRNRRSGGGRRR